MAFNLKSFSFGLVRTNFPQGLLFGDLSMYLPDSTPNTALQGEDFLFMKVRP